jgi:hypothetical protein
MSNDEEKAVEAWRYLVADSVVNVYIMDGGVNKWLDTFGEADFKTAAAIESSGSDMLRYIFPMAYGEKHPASAPHEDRFEVAFEPHVVLAIKRGAVAGGCG